MAQRNHIFISYQSTQANFAWQLKEDLEKNCINVWFAPDKINPGDDWARTIEEALTYERCSGMVVVLSLTYIASNICLNELARAEALKIPIIPVLIEPISDKQRPIEVQRLHHIDLTDCDDDHEYQRKLNQLVDAIRMQGMDEEFISKNSVELLIAGFEGTVHSFRAIGKAQSAIDKGDDLIDVLMKLIADGKKYGYSINFLHTLEKTLARVQYEQSIAQRELSLPDDVVTDTEKITEDLQTISKRLAGEYGDEDGFGLLCSHEGDVQYIAGNDEAAIESFELALLYLEKNPLIQLQVLRALAIAHANLREEAKLAEVVQRINENIKHGGYTGNDLEEVCQAYEGMARAYAKLKSPDGFLYLQKGFEVYSQVPKAHFRYIQLGRTQLESEPYLDADQRKLLQSIGMDILVLARSHPRYEALLKELFDKRDKRRPTKREKR